MKRKILWYAFDFSLMALGVMAWWLAVNRPHPIAAILGVAALPRLSMAEQGAAKLYMTKKEYFEFCNEI